MDRLQRTWLVRIAAYIAAMMVGLSVVLATAVGLNVREPEPSESVVLLILGAAAVVAIFLGRVTYRGVSGLLGRSLSARV